MNEVTASQLTEGDSYMYSRGAGPKKEVMILSSESDPASRAYRVMFKYPNKDTEFSVGIQNGTAVNATHKFFELPEEVPGEAGPGDRSVAEPSEDPAAAADEDPSGGRKRRRRKTAKRKTKKASRKHKRRTLKK
jgi:hypothetical protein